MLAMLVPMVLILMLELMVPTTLARGLLMLSLRPRLMLLFSMELTDMLDMLLPLPMDTLDMPDMLDTLMPLMVHMLITDKQKPLISNLHQEKLFIFHPSIKTKIVMNFNFKILLTVSDYLSSATLWSL